VAAVDLLESFVLMRSIPALVWELTLLMQAAQHQFGISGQS
jgi:hypothetical protein